MEKRRVINGHGRTHTQTIVGNGRGDGEKRSRRGSLPNEMGRGLDTAGSPPEPKLSPRQAAVARLAARGLCDCEIAAELGLSENTVGAYLQAVYKKFGVHSRAALAIRLLEDTKSDGVL